MPPHIPPAPFAPAGRKRSGSGNGGEAAVARSRFRIGPCRTAAPNGNGHIEAFGTSCPGTGAGATPWPVRATPNASAPVRAVAA